MYKQWFSDAENDSGIFLVQFRSSLQSRSAALLLLGVPTLYFLIHLSATKSFSLYVRITRSSLHVICGSIENIVKLYLVVACEESLNHVWRNQREWNRTTNRKMVNNELILLEFFRMHSVCSRRIRTDKGKNILKSDGIVSVIEVTMYWSLDRSMRKCVLKTWTWANN